MWGHRQNKLLDRHTSRNGGGIEHIRFDDKSRAHDVDNVDDSNTKDDDKQPYLITIIANRLQRHFLVNLSRKQTKKFNFS